MEVVKDLLPILLSAVQEKYASDPSAPCVLVSRLPDARYYASIKRYREAFGKNHYAVGQAVMGDIFEEVIEALAKTWAESLPASDKAKRASPAVLKLCVLLLKASPPEESDEFDAMLERRKRQVKLFSTPRRDNGPFWEQKFRTEVVGVGLEDAPNIIPEDWTDPSGKRAKQIAAELRRVQEDQRVRPYKDGDVRKDIDGRTEMRIRGFWTPVSGLKDGSYVVLATKQIVGADGNRIVQKSAIQPKKQTAASRFEAIEFDTDDTEET